MPNQERLTRGIKSKHLAAAVSAAAHPQSNDATNGAPTKYLQAIDSLLLTVFKRYSNRDLSFQQLFTEMRGAYPTLILDRLATAWGGTLSSISLTESPKVADEYYPELHALDFEWYFDGDSARTLAREFSLRRGQTLYLGTPTVAASAAELGRNITLVDRNRLIPDRFPCLSRNSDFRIMSVEQTFQLSTAANCVVFDAPWYLKDIVGWLRAASHIVTPNGSVIFPLFPPFVRPEAKRERDIILDLASSIGSVSLTEDAIVYQTPLFEREALAYSGVAAGNWRRGDLVVITVRRSAELPKFAPLHISNHNTWRTFVVDGQVIKVRNKSHQKRAARCELIQPLSGSNKFVYTSVSSRDPRRRHIDLWTSRNRAAHLTETKLIVDILEQLQRGATVSQATNLLVSSLKRNQLRSVRRAIRTVLMTGST